MRLLNRLDAALQVKFAGDGGEMTFAGYGAVFGNQDFGGDVIEKGAFKKSLREQRKTGDWPAMLALHGGWSVDDNMPVGVWTEIEEDDTGLRVEGRLAKTARGLEMYELLKMQPRPALNGLSIGYVAKDFRVGTKPGEPRRTLKEVELIEISLVTRPMNPKARVDGVKGLPPKDVERALRDACGLSREQAKAFMAKGYAGLIQREAGGSGAEPSARAALEDLIATIRR